MLCIISVIMTGCVYSNRSPIKANPTDIADNRLALAIAYMQNSQPDKALKNLQRAQRVAPKYLPTLLAFAHYYTLVQDTPRAADTYQQAIARYPHNSQLLHNFGIFVCRQGDYQQAQAYFSQAIQQPGYSHTALTYDSAAQCLWRANQPQAAIESMRAAVNHAPNDMHMVNRLMKMYLNNQQAARACQLLQQYGERLSPIQRVQWQHWLDARTQPGQCSRSRLPRPH